jgi:hypothetical protein
MFPTKDKHASRLQIIPNVFEGFLQVHRPAERNSSCSPFHLIRQEHVFAADRFHSCRTIKSGLSIFGIFSH